MNQQQQNHDLRTESSQILWGAEINFTGQIFALDSAVVKTQNLLRFRRGFLTYVIYHHIVMTHKKGFHRLYMSKLKKNPKLNHSEPKTTIRH